MKYPLLHTFMTIASAGLTGVGLNIQNKFDAWALIVGVAGLTLTFPRVWRYIFGEEV